MNAIDLLIKQHKIVKRALNAMSESDSIADAELSEIADQLVAHMVIEEHVFYPRVKELKSDLVSESFEEHTVARFELGRAIIAKGEDRKSRVTVLKELIEHHVEEEEKEMFPKVRAGIPQAELEALGQRMEAMFERAAKRGFAGLMSDGQGRGVRVRQERSPVVQRAAR